MERRLTANGSLSWCHGVFDFSAVHVSANGGTAALVLTSVANATVDGVVQGYITKTGSPSPAYALLYVTSVTSGTIKVNDQISGSGISPTYVVSNPNAGSPYVVSVPQDVASVDSPITITATTTNWPTTTTRTATDWEALVDVDALTNVTTATSTAKCTTAACLDIVGSGALSAVFDGGASNTVTLIDTSPLGALYKVVASPLDAAPISASGVWSSGTETVTATAHGLAVGNKVLLGSTPKVACVIATAATNSFTCPSAGDPGTVTSEAPFNRNITVTMYYLVYEKADTTLGPIRSWGPIIDNTQLHLTVPALSSLAALSYDAAFTRNGSTVRAYTGLTTPSLAHGSMLRPDGQGDWSANDPGVWISQNYGLVVDTGKVPPIKKGVAYVGGGNSNTGPFPTVPITAINTTTGAWTGTFMQGNIFGPGPWIPQSVEVQSTGTIPGGISASTVYWATNTGVPTNNATLYDSFAHASAAGATGKIIPSTTGSGAISWIAALSPGSTGSLDCNIGQSGNRPELSVMGEWFMGGYLAGNTLPWQQLARVMAYDNQTLQLHGVESTTGDIPSLMDAPNTPASLGPSYALTTWFGMGYGASSNINGGANPAGSTGCWSYGGSTSAHTPNIGFGVWLLEGSPPYPDFAVEQANGMAAFATYLPQRNPIMPSGRQYFSQTLCVYGQAGERVAAWKFRDVILARFIAPQGSDRQLYITNVAVNNTDLCDEYQAYQPAPYSTNGLVFNNTGFNGSTSHLNTALQPAGFEPFFNGFLGTDISFGAELVGDYIPGLVTQANFISQWFIKVYNGLGGSYCTYWSMPYESGLDKACFGDAAPGNFFTADDVGIQNNLEAVMSFQDGSSTLTCKAGCIPYDGHNGAGAPLSVPVTEGDHFRTWNYSANVGPAKMQTPPSPFSCGTTDYVIGNLTLTGSGAVNTMTLSPIGGGADLVAAGIPITNISIVGNAATFTTATPHGLVTTPYDTNSKVNIAGVTSTGPGSYNGTFAIPQVPDATHFILTNTTSPGTATGFGTATPGGVHGIFIPKTTSCPSNGLSVTFPNNSENYMMYAASALATMAKLGIAGASTAYTNAMARFTGNCKYQLDWCMEP
ncbi:MAG: hypothetical protein WA459_21495 [Stellaceae bacterium]